MPGTWAGKKDCWRTAWSGRRCAAGRRPPSWRAMAARRYRWSWAGWPGTGCPVRAYRCGAVRPAGGRQSGCRRRGR